MRMYISSERNNCFKKGRIHIIASFKKVTFQKGNKELITLSRYNELSW